MHKHIVRFGDNPAALINLALLDAIAADEVADPRLAGRYCIMHDHGMAMMPEFGTDDPLLVDRNVKRFQGDAIYVFSINGQVYIRALQCVFSKPGNVLRAIPYNKTYETFEIDEDATADFEIFGRVIQYWHGKRC